ncbi:UDP-4-amino-4,6-dideoxy-N-acetyl-beta-L-altrosamine transaminase [Methanospirillum sp. J.3.6.1-F.2.7.3]|uniref:UDP-4-amino-4, 6-dideoxy-N-acetyl-beta-L-altrosamine transaminase n=1 Tax=Methanospirillum purgamenti TaxID=2834276 RepID=A0A8E7EK77_9EURY|nr:MULTISPECIES: UDP-4-amino-4,6-dideoxy-N-acetyl-beta-L-altrosamine transaminase [Methanospirillum]MDX8549498.1 UDP-4-amino-4,6-dideoxy-N-acetyl-beta-L-altrosamine transaminase [Methanospirillum hungatei]QVV89220.1 UDP-4-amino-4,6-dideoxy-N-acetyl-beta-L-altrosamine transaminase [Methanospirillum sp. J.3.6.1-F.2.7.3]
MIPYGRQDIIQEDIDSVISILKSDFITQGPVVPKFEKAVVSKVHAKHAIAVNSGTSALHIACLALGLGPGDWLWTVPNTFVASANCGRYCGANIDFVDVDPETWNMSATKLSAKLEEAREKKCLPKVVVPVHFAGQPTEQEKIWDLSKKYGFRILEDASHSIGASRNGEPVGSCRWSDITVFSFHPVKIITTAEGGMALTNDNELAQLMTLYRSHGITRDPDHLLSPSPGPWYYEQQMLGFNYRMTDIQAGLGLSQLQRLDSYVARRNYLAKKYSESLQGLPIQLPSIDAKNISAFHLFVIRLKLDELLPTRTEIFLQLQSKGIGVNVHYMPVYMQPYYQKLGFSKGQFPEADKYAEDVITLPLFPLMTDNEQEIVIKSLTEILTGVRRIR